MRQRVWVRAGGRHAFLAIAVKICEFMPNSAAVATAATTAARHSKVPWLKVSKELHMLLSHCLHVRLCVCVCGVISVFPTHWKARAKHTMLALLRLCVFVFVPFCMQLLLLFY